jgi:hypothetical protein
VDRVAVAVSVGVAVITIVEVIVAAGSSGRGPIRAGCGTMGGGVSGTCDGRASAGLAQFTSKKRVRMSSTKALMSVRDNICKSVAQG